MKSTIKRNVIPSYCKIARFLTSVAALLFIPTLLFCFRISQHGFLDPFNSAVGPHFSSHGSGSKVPMARLHYLIPTSTVTAAVCASVASALLNRYSVPILVGYRGEGEYDARAAHIAKLRAIRRYIHTQPEASKDDLIIVVDGFDVLAQIPAEATIQLYFELMESADKRVADRHGISVEEVKARGLHHSMIWGTDKGCFPGIWESPHCWLVPHSNLLHNQWGPKSRTGGVEWSDSRFLNSGTVMGTLGDLGTLMDSLTEYIDRKFNPDFEYRNSDQYYVANFYARQEYHRNLQLLGEGEEYPELEGNRRLPAEKKGDNDTVEFHMTVDAGYAFAQTQCWNEAFISHLKYDKFGKSALVTHDALEEEKRFKPYEIQMPSPIYQSLENLYNSLDESDRPASSARLWIQNLPMWTNLATRHIFAFYHNTCNKDRFLDKLRNSWFYPDGIKLLETAAKRYRANEPINAQRIQGKMWVASQQLPASADGYEDEVNMLGGVFTDFEEEPYIPFRQLCGDHIESL